MSAPSAFTPARRLSGMTRRQLIPSPLSGPFFRTIQTLRGSDQTVQETAEEIAGVIRGSQPGA
jgi:hypothetical protein